MTIPCQALEIQRRCNDYSTWKYMSGEIPAWKCLAPRKEGEDIVYSPNKYRETEGKKEKQLIYLTTEANSSMKNGLISPQKCGPRDILSSCIALIT